MKTRICRCRGKKENDIDYETAKKFVNDGAFLIDVRSPQEFKEKNLNGSINISLYDINKIDKYIIDKNKTIILYCEYGKRSRKARQILLQKGYKNVYTLAGGMANI